MFGQLIFLMLMANAKEPTKLGDIGLVWPLSFKLESLQQRSGDKLKFTEVLGKEGDQQVKITITQPLSREEAQTLAGQNLRLIEKMYGNQELPYRGKISAEQNCAQKFQPK